MTIQDKSFDPKMTGAGTSGGLVLKTTGRHPTKEEASLDGIKFPKEFIVVGSMSSNDSDPATYDNLRRVFEQIGGWLTVARPRTTYTAKFGDGTTITVKFKPRG